MVGGCSLRRVPGLWGRQGSAGHGGFFFFFVFLILIFLYNIYF
jgi:hypothetical protein